MNPIDLKIAYIGGGSRGWARKLMIDLALCPDLTGQVALYDIDMESARLNEQLGNWLQGQPGVVSRWRYATVDSLDDALRGADFVVVSIQPGTLEIMGQEIAIAERYGMFFPVGDTAGALPPGPQAIVARHVSNQEMIVEAALTGDKELAFQAVYNDPANVLPVDECWAMFNELLRANRDFLPGWKTA